VAFLSGFARWGHHPLYVQGIRHFTRGEFARAVECFDGVLREIRDPDHPDVALATVHLAQARANLGLACFHAGDFAGAEQAFTCVLEGQPGYAELRVLRARIYERSGRLIEAVADLGRALEDHPRNVEAHLLLAVCLGQMGDGAGSAAALEQAQALGFDLPSGLSAGRAAQWGVADWQRLVPELLGAPADAARGEDRAHQALARHQLGDIDGAIAALEQAVQARPTFPDLRVRLADLYLGRGRAAEALAQLEAALGIHPHFLEARMLAVRSLLELKEAHAAAARAEALVHDHPSYPDLRFWLGLSRFRAGDLKGAAVALEQAVGIHRDFARAHRLLGLVHHALGDHERALESLRRGLSRDRELPQAMLEATLPLLALGDAAAAEGELRRAIAIRPDYPDLHLALARALRLRGDLPAAAGEYRVALDLAEGLSAATLELAAVELALSRPDAAETLLAELATRHPGWADVHAQLGRTRLLRGDSEGAEEALRAALFLNPDYGIARADLGWALLAQGRAGEADAEFARALELDPLHALPRQQLAWREMLLPPREGAA